MILERILSLVIKKELSGAFLYAGSARIWQGGIGIIFIYAISSYYSADMQGFYYTILSLLTMQAFFELGLSVALMNFVSHEWASLKFVEGRIIGDDVHLSRLSDAVRKTIKWFLFVSLLYILMLTVIGYIFLSSSKSAIDWEIPWLCSVGITGVLIITIPLMSIMEGCGKVEEVSKFRLIEAVSSSILAVIAIFLGFGLWAIVVQLVARLFVQIIFLGYKNKDFFKQIYEVELNYRIDWIRDIFPLQSKLAIHAVIGYFSLGAINPIVFYFIGANEAGILGMSLQITGVLSSLGAVWVQVCAPGFANLIARKKYSELERFYKNVLLKSTSIIALISFSIIMGMVVFKSMDVNILDRLLPLGYFSLLLVTVISLQATQIQSAYMRAFKIDEALPLNIVTTLFTLITVTYFAYAKNMPGVIFSFVFFRIIISIWMAWLVLKRKDAWVHKTVENMLVSS